LIFGEEHLRWKRIKKNARIIPSPLKRLYARASVIRSRVFTRSARCDLPFGQATPFGFALTLGLDKKKL